MLNNEKNAGIDKSRLDNIKKLHIQFPGEIDILKKSLSYFHEDESFNDVKKVIHFFEEDIAMHFKEEEDYLFPVALMIGDLKIKKIVRDLQKEHIDIFSEMDKIKEIVIKPGFSFKDKEVRDEFVRISKNALEKIIIHARKEDDELFPYLESKGVRPDIF